MHIFFINKINNLTLLHFDFDTLKIGVIVLKNPVSYKICLDQFYGLQSLEEF